MRCAWKELMSILPPWLRQQGDKLEKEPVQEIRLRLDGPPEFVIGGRSKFGGGTVGRDDLNFCINTASRYSPWNSASMSRGYITAPGGHRIGICGDAVIKDGMITGIREVTSLCIRVARYIPGIAHKAAGERDSVLIIGPPGWGKTTLLRDLICQISDQGKHVAVVDERSEIFPVGFPRGKFTDVLCGCGKGEGIDMVLRTMGPQYIAVDEITSAMDCQGLLHAGWCGVRLLATAHAASVRDLKCREVYRPLTESQLFSTVLVMDQDKSWRKERLE